MLSLFYPFQEVLQMSIQSLCIESSMHACAFYQYHYGQFCYRIAISVANKKISIILLRLIVTLTYHFLNIAFNLPNACNLWVAF